MSDGTTTQQQDRPPRPQPRPGRPPFGTVQRPAAPAAAQRPAPLPPPLTQEQFMRKLALEQAVRLNQHSTVGSRRTLFEDHGLLETAARFAKYIENGDTSPLVRPAGD